MKEDKNVYMLHDKNIHTVFLKNYQHAQENKHKIG